MSKNIRNLQDRTLEQIKEHYEIEKKLAKSLLNSNSQERVSLYSKLYDELFRQVSHHPQLTRKANPQQEQLKVAKRLKLLQPFLNRNLVFLEVGSGDCHFSLEVAKQVKRVYAVDVSQEITSNPNFPDNFELIISDGTSIPVTEGSINLAYSNQLMEHLHPDDALQQLKNIYEALAEHGVYVCITPNRFNGPHDISGYFDRVASGFHLKEYSVTELAQLFTQVGFSQLKVRVGVKGIYGQLPIWSIKICEALLEILPYKVRKYLANTLPFSIILGITIIGIKETRK